VPEGFLVSETIDSKGESAGVLPARRPTSSRVARAPGSADTAAFALMASVASAGLARADFALMKKSLREAIASDPLEANLVTVAGGAYLFYLAEKGKNPKVQTYWDALVFVSTCMSVGYADVFARTPAGKAIASAIMTIGPALSGALLDEPKSPAESAPQAQEDERIAIQRVIVDKLDAILSELRANRPR
jgi:hypothetical protein